MSAIECPGDGKAMEKKIVTKDSTHQGVDITYTSERYVCPDCGVEVADVKQAADIQRVMGDAYRKKEGLLTSDDIIEGRQRLGLTRENPGAHDRCGRGQRKTVGKRAGTNPGHGRHLAAGA